eukprot:786064-Rhodomonas_salina.2
MPCPLADQTGLDAMADVAGRDRAAASEKLGAALGFGGLAQNAHEGQMIVVLMAGKLVPMMAMLRGRRVASSDPRGERMRLNG